MNDSGRPLRKDEYGVEGEWGKIPSAAEEMLKGEKG